MKQILLLSGKGGTGKTTAASAFVRFAKAQAIADCDVDAPNLHLVAELNTEPYVTDFFGGDKAVIDTDKCIGCGACEENCRFEAIEEKNGVFTVNEYACEGCGVCAAVCAHQAVDLFPDLAGRKELYFNGGVFSSATLKMGRGNSGKLVTEVKLAMIKNAPVTDIAVIDGSPGIGCPVIASVSGADLVLAVAEPSVSGISDLKRLIKTAKTFGTKLAVCVNKWDVDRANTEAIEAFCRAENISFVGKIPYDKTVSEAINAGKSVADIDCPAGAALKEIYINTMQLLK